MGHPRSAQGSANCFHYGTPDRDDGAFEQLRKTALRPYNETLSETVVDMQMSIKPAEGMS